MRILHWFVMALTAALSAVAGEMKAPKGYEVRDLGPMGGQILVPKSWFFVSGEGPSGPVFTLSKEENKNGYETGMRIQLVWQVKAKAGITPGMAVQMNIEKKKKSEEIIDECPKSKSGMFWRACLETVGFPAKAKPNKKFHMVYSYWWDDEMDLMMVATFGAPEDEWADAEKVYAVIKDFKLIDNDRAPTEPNFESSASRLP